MNPMTRQARIFYHTLTDEMTRQDKLQWFAQAKLDDIHFDHIQPDKNNNWINLAPESDWESFIPVADKEVKLGRVKEGAIFELFSIGVSTNRDEWVISYDNQLLIQKITYFISHLNAIDFSNIEYSDDVKWSRNLKRRLSEGGIHPFSENNIHQIDYRPYTKRLIYISELLIDELGQSKRVVSKENVVIAINGIGSSKPLQLLVSSCYIGVDTLEKTQCLPLYRYEKDGRRVENITDWALTQFRGHYGSEAIGKEDIFHYVYAVLHPPAYRRKYELNLKREFPRVPFYDNFAQWADWGRQLMALHLHYETVPPYPLQRIDHAWDRDRAPKAKLKSLRSIGAIELDEQTELRGIPDTAWDYKLGNRSALDWVLDQHKERTPKDPTIREKFNTYRFADYKEHVIDLLGRVCAVSVQTQAIIAQMPD